MVVGVLRALSLAYYRAAWIPVGPRVSARSLLARERGRLAGSSALGVLALLAVIGRSGWNDPTTVAFAVAIVLATLGGAVRALLERAGLERRAYALEWAVPLGTIAGACLLGGGAFGPALGLALGLGVGTLAVLPGVPWGPRGPAACPGRLDRTSRALLLDTLVYANLGLLDAALSAHVFVPGDYARLNYAYLFVNAVLAIPTSAAVVLGLRHATDRRATVWIRKAALLGALGAGGCVLAIAGALHLPSIAAAVDTAAGWSLAAAIAPLVLASAPFAALRLANTFGRQSFVATAPTRLLPADLLGLGLRATALVLLATWWGPLASPLALALAEATQLAAWLRPRTLA